MPEVRSALIFGGQILGGDSEPRKATIVINFVNKSEAPGDAKGPADDNLGRCSPISRTSGTGS